MTKRPARRILKNHDLKTLQNSETPKHDWNLPHLAGLSSGKCCKTVAILEQWSTVACSAIARTNCRFAVASAATMDTLLHCSQ